jgi:HK97 family phage major capsid protein
MLARLAGEVEDRQTFVDGLIEQAEKDGRDLSEQEMELVTRAKTRLGELDAQMEPLKEARRISGASRERVAEIARLSAAENGDKPPGEIKYRSAGEYILERWRAGLGDRRAEERLELYHRAAAHQTTADNSGLIPTPIIGPVVSFVDANRPLVSALGPRQLPGQNWSRPKVTQHTSVATQSAEKAELVSQKMTITKINGVATTYGGYVNVSRQNIDFTQPGVMDIVINDLAAQYAVQTEAAASTAFAAAAQAGATLPTGANTQDQVAGALWDAAGKLYTATKGIGRVFAVIPTGLLGAWGPLFPPYGPMNQQGQGFDAASFNSGLAGSIAGIPVYVSPAIAANTALVFSTAAAEVYEERIGSLQVVEPSVLGVQVAYAGYFTPLVVEPTGIVKITKTP